MMRHHNSLLRYLHGFTVIEDGVISDVAFDREG